MTSLVRYIELAYTLDCDRCAFSAVAYEPTYADAEREFTDQGWTCEDGRVYCPQCSGTVLPRHGARCGCQLCIGMDPLPREPRLTAETHK